MVLTAVVMLQGYHTLVSGINSISLETVWVPLRSNSFVLPYDLRTPYILLFLLTSDLNSEITDRVLIWC